MKLDAKTLHVVAYAKKRGAEPEVVGHGEVARRSELDRRRSISALWNVPLVSQVLRNGRVEIASRTGERLGTLVPGKPLAVEHEGVELRVEARQVVDRGGKVLTSKAISPLALRALERRLQTQVASQQRVLEMRRRLAHCGDRAHAALQAFAAATQQTLKAVEQLPNVALVEASLTARAQGAEAAWAKASGRLAARLARSTLTEAQGFRIGDEMQQALRDVQAALALRSDGRWTGALAELVQLHQVTAQLMDEAPRHLGRRAAAARREVDVALRSLEAHCADPTRDFTLRNAAAAVQALGGPKLWVRGTATVTAVVERGELTHWAVRFENRGAQPFVGTMVFPTAAKNDGIGFESMALPAQGDAAEQLIQLNGYYGVRPQPGVEVRLGVRSYGWHNVRLPAQGSVEVSLRDFTIEDNGANRREDFDPQLVAGKRHEKYFTGKVRFFSANKPWAPAQRHR